MQVSGPVKEDTVTGPKIAAVERREARVPDRKGTRAPHKVPRCYQRRSGAPPPHARGGRSQRRLPRACSEGADGARPQAKGNCFALLRAADSPQTAGDPMSDATPLEGEYDYIDRKSVV